MTNLPNRDLLLASHAFPGPYVIKAFGPGDDRFRAAIRGATERAVEDRYSITERTTRSGSAVCLTVTLRAETVDEVLASYTEMAAVPRLKIIL